MDEHDLAAVDDRRMRVLLADDEPLALERLQLALSGLAQATLVGTARNGREALELIRERRPDVAVLDVQMPVADGFAVIEALRDDDAVPEFIFVTAFHHHAIRAFEVQAVDYLLKPVAFERFHEALRRAQARLAARTSGERLEEVQRLLEALHAAPDAGAAAPDGEIWVQESGGLTRIATSVVDRIEAEGDYVRIHVGDRSHLLKETITAMQSRLDAQAFARVHRSSIVNLTRVRSVRRRTPRGIVLVLQGGATVAVGPSFADEVMRLLQARRWRSS
jgi:DNA-binding LytR/AlgR family response regulator